MRDGDVRDVLRIHSEMGWPLTAEAARSWLSLRPWSEVLVAEVGGRVVGKVTVDLEYRPYSEIVNLAVLPGYAESGVGRRLVEAALAEAERAGFWVQTAMVDPSDGSSASLFRSLGFIPVITPIRRGDCSWFFRFSRGSPPASFLERRPGSGLEVMGGSRMHVVSWVHRSGDRLDLLVEGRPGQVGEAPRVAGTGVRLGELEVGLRAEYLGRGRVTLVATNAGEVEAEFSLRGPGWDDVEVDLEARSVGLGPGERAFVGARVSPRAWFSRPALSFPDILVTFEAEARGFSPLMATAAVDRRGGRV